MGLNALTITLAALVLLIILWFLRRPMSKRQRRLAPGQFATVEDGVIHYQWHGPADGPILVLVHGLTTPSFVWRAMLPGLTKAGFRVLTFDHFGRGYSDRPFQRYDLAFYARTLDGLFANLRIEGPVHMLGYSMGGGIVAQYAAIRRDRVDHAILLASVGFSDKEPVFVARWPIIGDVLMFLFGPSRIRADARKSAELEKTDAEYLRLQIRETRFAGYTGAVLSSLRHAIYMDQTKAHEQLRDLSVPLLAIFARDDDLIGDRAWMRIREINSHAELNVIEGAGHAVAMTHADEVVSSVLAFLPPARPLK